MKKTFMSLKTSIAKESKESLAMLFLSRQNAEMFLTLISQCNYVNWYTYVKGSEISN